MVYFPFLCDKLEESIGERDSKGEIMGRVGEVGEEWGCFAFAWD